MKPTTSESGTEDVDFRSTTHTRRPRSAISVLSKSRYDSGGEIGPVPPVDDNASHSLPAIADRLASIVRRTYGSACEVETRVVDVIPRDGGKLRYYGSSGLTGT